MRHAIKKITKRVRELADTAYDKNGYVRDAFSKGPNGCSRTVIIEDQVAYKLAQGPHDSNHNRSEWDLWNRLPNNVRAMTAKPLAISNCHMVLAMEFISGGTLRKSYENRMDKDGYYPVNLENDNNSFNDKLRHLLEASEKFSKHEIAVMMTITTPAISRCAQTENCAGSITPARGGKHPALSGLQWGYILFFS